MLYGGGLCSIGLAVWLALPWITANTATTIPPDPTRLSVNTSDTQPDERRVPLDAEYTVPSSQPRRITIPAVGVNGFIEKVGILPDGAVGVPSNIHFAGWLETSGYPGGQGLTIIDGHVSGRYNTAIFSKLYMVQLGDTIAIEHGDKSMKEFVIVDKKQVPERDAAAILFEKRSDIAEQLNVITCGGVYNAAARTFEDRVIVIARAL